MWRICPSSGQSTVSGTLQIHEPFQAQTHWSVHSAEKMTPSRRFLLLLCLGSFYLSANAAPLGKLAENKLCADEECAYVISMATALEDFVAPDCRFINLKRGQMIFVYSKLVPEGGAGVFWSGSIYSNRYVDQLGIIGYFPVNYVNETYIFQKDTVNIPATNMDFFCH
ncbi:otoraplin-like [Denticeps clupeoides]|uniref:SH3 domain-containing protein n=1 Tax=Denticeps clupeoides TaxID=299321 RepID=A0AAY4DFP8_9TELE|nr:otoraplin [Denticeps clupeoides]